MIRTDRLRHRLVFFLVLSLVLVAGLAVPLAGENDSENILSDLRFEPLVYTPPAITRSELDCGTMLYEVPDNSLPFFSLTLLFPGGTNAEAIATAGQLQTLVDLLDRTGAGEQSGEAISEELAGLGARLSFSASYESWQVSVTALKRDFPRVMEIVRSKLVEARFREEELRTVRTNLITAIRQRNDEPARVAYRKLEEVLYPGLRRGYSFQVADIERIDVPRMQTELSRRLRCNGSYAAVSGDYRDLPVRETLNALFAAFPDQVRGPIETETGDYEAMRALNRARYANSIVLVNMPVPQTVIALGGILPAHNHGDFYALQAGNYVLGGGSFNSRLMREIRVKRGLAYYAYSYNAFGADGGLFISSTATRSEQASESLQLLVNLVSEMANQPIEEGELSLAIDAILNGFVFQFDNPSEIAGEELRFRLHNMPEDYLAGFPTNMRSVTRPEIQRVFARYLKPADLFVVVVGPEQLRAQLEELRRVVVIGPEEAPYASDVSGSGSLRLLP